MESGQDDPHALVLAYGRTGHFELTEDLRRQAEPFDEVEVPVLLRGVEQRRRRRVGVLVDDPTRKRVVEILGHHQEVRGLRQLLGMLLLERPELVDGIEARLLDAGARIELRKGKHLLLDLRIRARSARVAIGDGVGAALALLVQEDEVDAPRVDADRLDRALRKSHVDPRFHRSDETVQVPAVVAVPTHLGILKAEDLFEDDLTVLDAAEDVPARRRANVNRKIILHHALIISKGPAVRRRILV